MKVRKILLIVVLLVVILAVLGRNFIGKKDVEHMAIANKAVSNQDYELASHHAKLARIKNLRNREAKILLDYLDYEDYMVIAAFWQKDPEAMTYLANIIHDINIKDPKSKASTLVLAAAWGHLDMVEILLEAGADPNVGTDTRNGLTALMWACKNFDEQEEMARILLEAGADVNAISSHDETPLSIAYDYDNPNIVKLLKEYGAEE